MRILRQRLLHAATLPDNDLILECYHPSARISTPSLACRYLGTGSLEASSPGKEESEPASLASLANLYSRFRPALAEEHRRPRMRWPRRVTTSQTPPQEADETATEEIHLDEAESFSQLCTVTNLVKVGPRHGLFLSLVNLNDGVVRVWRDWLSAAADGQHEGEQGSGQRGILWADASKTVGLRFRVQPSSAERMPVLVGPGDEPAVSYTLTYQGKSLGTLSEPASQLTMCPRDVCSHNSTTACGGEIWGSRGYTFR